MSDPIEKSLLEARRSTRSRVSRLSLTRAGRPLDLTPVTEGVRSRAGKIGLAVAALFALVVTASFMIRPSEERVPITGKPVALMEIPKGSVTMLPAGAIRARTRLLPLKPGAPVHAGAIVETEAGGGAALRLTDGASLRLDADTRVQVASGSAVVLDRGTVYLDSRSDGSGIEVRTTLGMVRDIGTQFEVRLSEGDDPPLRVRVREGKIILRHGQQSHQAVAGDELVMSPDGTVALGGTPGYGPHWDWVLATAPVPELEGLDLRSFLAWFTREGGWAVRFSDSELADHASTIILHGNATGLNPHQAANMALRGSGLEYHVEDGEVVVAQSDSPQP